MGQVVENRLFILMIRRPPRSTLDRSSAASDVYKRQDLFYRLNVVALRVPPLRERRDDIPLLAAHFLRKHCGAAAPTLSPDALDVLVADPWPGNVRELENALLHAIAFHHGDLIGRASLPAQIGARSTTGGAPPETAP